MKKKTIIIVTVLVVCALVAVAVFSGDASSSELPSPEKLMPYEDIYLGMSLEEFDTVKPENCRRLPNDGESYAPVDGVHTKLSDLAIYKEKVHDEKNTVICRWYHFPINVEYKPEYTDYLSSVSEEITIQYGNKVSEEEMQEFVTLAEKYKAAFIEEFSLTDEIVSEPFMEYEGHTPVIDSMWRPEGKVWYSVFAGISYDPQEGYYGHITRGAGYDPER